MNQESEHVELIWISIGLLYVKIFYQTLIFIFIVKRFFKYFLNFTIFTFVFDYPKKLNYVNQDDDKFVKYLIRGAVKKFCRQAAEKSKKGLKNSKKQLLEKEQNLLLFHVVPIVCKHLSSSELRLFFRRDSSFRCNWTSFFLFPLSIFLWNNIKWIYELIFVLVSRKNSRNFELWPKLLNTIMVEVNIQIFEYTFNCSNEFLVCGKSSASHFFLEPWKQVIVTWHEVWRVWRVLKHLKLQKL